MKVKYSKYQVIEYYANSDLGTKKTQEQKKTQ